MDEGDKRRQANELQRELSQTRLSRRAFLDRLAALGIGFGAASVLGVKNADARSSVDSPASVQSTNPALNTIIEEGRQDREQFQNVAEESGGYGGTPGKPAGWGNSSSGGKPTGDGYGGSGGSSGSGSNYSRAYSRSTYERYARAYTRYERAVYTRYERAYTRYDRAVYTRYARYSRGYGGSGGGGGGGYGGGR